MLTIRIVEIKDIRVIQGKTRCDRVRSEDPRVQSGIQEVANWIR